jgi:hypothetical protein
MGRIAMAQRNPADQKSSPSLSRGSPINCAVQKTAPSPLFPEETPQQRTQMDYLQFLSLMESFGITDRGFIGPLFEADGFGGDGVEFAAAVIKGLSPRDQLEAMLGAQMAVMHWASMKCMRQVADRRDTSFQEPAVAMATKLARTFAAEMEVLKRYRSGGEQKVTVQHVRVGKGGRAIVGTVNTRSRKPVLEKPADEPPVLSDQRAPATPVPGDLEYEKQAWLEYVAKKKSS